MQARFQHNESDIDQKQLLEKFKEQGLGMWKQVDDFLLKGDPRSKQCVLNQILQIKGLTDKIKKKKIV